MKKGIKLPEEILCFELLSSANIIKPEKKLILSGMNFEKKDDLFDPAKKSLKKFKGELASNNDIVGATAALKLEPTFVTSQEEGLITDNFQYQRFFLSFLYLYLYFFLIPRGRGIRGAANYRGRKTNRGGSARGNEYVKPVNPKGPDGNPLSCHGCGSYRHLVGACPHSHENARKVDEVCNTVLSELQQPERKNAILKLHEQFAYPSIPRLKALMADAGAWKDVFQEELNEIYRSCNTCKLYGMTPARSVVSMPMPTRYNEKVAMDLKSWKGKYIIHMIDMFTRLSISVFINRKNPEEVVENVLQHWIGAGWGVMEGIFFDNGGEFNNDEVREVASLLNVRISSTPAESPWSNGLCERNHQITDRMVEILVEENPHTNEKLLFAWANVAKNLLQMWNGFSSSQLVLGKNPNLPNIVTMKLPALQGVSSSEILKTHLDALFSTRRAFMKSEADEKIRRALRHQIRTSEEVFGPGDSVFYKRDGSNKWLGPGKVIFQDGKVVFVRHGGTYVRVSKSRLVKETANSGSGSPKPEK